MIRADGGDRRGDDAGSRLNAECRRALFGHHEDSGRPVIERARITRGDRPPGPEGRLELSELLHRGPRTRTVVAGNVAGGHDFAVKVPAVTRRDGAILRDHRPFILSLATHPAARGDVLGRLPHRDVDVVERALGAVEAWMRVERRVLREARDGLDTRGDVLISLSGLDRVEGHPDRLKR
jgi:hypothetical protein